MKIMIFGLFVFLPVDFFEQYPYNNHNAKNTSISSGYKVWTVVK